MQYSIVNYKKIEELPTFRLDSEYFHPDFLHLDKIINEKRNRFKTINELGLYIDASAFYPTLEPYYNSGIVPFIRVSDVDLGINYDNCLSIPRFIFNEYKTLKMGYEGDIVITKGGSIGRVGLINEASALSRDLIYINSSNMSKRDYMSLYIYTMTYIYNAQLIRSSSMTAQPHLTLTLVKDIPIYIPTEKFKINLEKLYIKYEKYKTQSRLLYLEAEKIILDEMKLLNFLPTHKLSYIKIFSDTQKAERLDADYYQPKYDAVEQAIYNYPNGWTKVKDEFTINKTKFKKISGRKYNYVEIGSVNVSNGEIVPTELLGETLPANAKIKLKENDVVVSKVRPYRGAIGIVDSDSYVGSGAFTVLHENGQINKETLFAFFRCPILLGYSLKYNSGTSYPVITNNDILNYPIPIIKDEIQEEIKIYINSAIDLRKKSKQLLEIAKTGVEIAIEQDEEVAINWMNEQVDMLGVDINA